jgi:hypothetical protein
MRSRRHATRSAIVAELFLQENEIGTSAHVGGMQRGRYQQRTGKSAGDRKRPHGISSLAPGAVPDMNSLRESRIVTTFAAG